MTEPVLTRARVTVKRRYLAAHTNVYVWRNEPEILVGSREDLDAENSGWHNEADATVCVCVFNRASCA